MNCLDVPGEVSLACKLHSTLGTLVVLHPCMGLVMHIHVTFLVKPPPALRTLVLYPEVNSLLVLGQCPGSGVTLATLLSITWESFHLGVDWSMLRQLLLVLESLPAHLAHVLPLP